MKDELKSVDILHKIIPNQAEDILLLFSKQKCSGTVVKNDKKTLKDRATFFHKTAILFFIIATPIILGGIIGISLTAGYSSFLMLPFFLIIISGALLISLAFKDDTTSKMLGKAVKDFQNDKKYVVIYYTPKTLIHELFHIKKGHLGTKGSNLKQDWEIMPDVWKTLRELRREVI